MDPLSQAVVGASLAGTYPKNRLRQNLTLGTIGGLFPDIDVIIKSATDPLLSLEYHRHFTHSIFLSPLVALVLSAMLYWAFYKKSLSFKAVYMPVFLGVVTHGMLDTFTAYGTYLLWPFSNARVSLENISIIDPLFTIPVFICVVLAAIFKCKRFVWASIVWMVLYLCFTFFQQYHVKQATKELAASRGHTIERTFYNPTFGNQIVWRSVYEYNGKYYADGVRYTPFSGAKVYEGGSVRKLEEEPIYKTFNTETQNYRDILRFKHFANGFVYMSAPNYVGDFRYSALPQDTKSLWGIELTTEKPEQHVRFGGFGSNNRKQALQTLWQMIKGT